MPRRSPEEHPFSCLFFPRLLFSSFVEPTLFVLDLFQEGMEAVFKSGRLEELIPCRCAEQKSGCAIADELATSPRTVCRGPCRDQ
jgi:hypothetical protein